jgi:hypothetical protein
MGKMSKYFLAIVLAGSILYAADGEKGTSESSTASKSQATTTTQQAASGTAKAKIITPAPKTNWSKIKDLFM